MTSAYTPAGLSNEPFNSNLGQEPSTSTRVSLLLLLPALDEVEDDLQSVIDPVHLLGVQFPTNSHQPESVVDRTSLQAIGDGFLR